jgi:hypothetical protein
MIVCSAEPGACCDVITAECLDEVPVLDCLELGPAWQTHPALPCDGLAPPCGDPGCCCDFPEPGEQTEPHFAFHANCAGRFIPGAYPLCGDLDQSGTVDISDYNMFLDAFGTCVGQSGYNAAADLDGDGCVSLVDFQAWRNCYRFQDTGCAADLFDPLCGIREIWFDLSVGQAPPPPTLCYQEMTPFPPDPRPLLEDVTDIPSPCPIPGVIGLDPPLSQRRIGAGWMAWSHGYTGDVYYTNGGTSVTLTMPPATIAVYFYVEQNNSSSQLFQALVNGTVLSEPVCSPTTQGGAVYIGVCGTAASPIETIEVTCINGDSFAIGDIGLACTEAGFARACGDRRQWECLALSGYTNWSGGESCDDPEFLCPGTIPPATTATSTSPACRWETSTTRAAAITITIARRYRRWYSRAWSIRSR